MIIFERSHPNVTSWCFVIVSNRKPCPKRLLRCESTPPALWASNVNLIKKTMNSEAVFKQFNGKPFWLHFCLFSVGVCAATTAEHSLSQCYRLQCFKASIVPLLLAAVRQIKSVALWIGRSCAWDAPADETLLQMGATKAEHSLSRCYRLQCFKSSVVLLLLCKLNMQHCGLDAPADGTLLQMRGAKGEHSLSRCYRLQCFKSS